MALPPIVERELRLASRRPETYRARLGSGLIALAIVCWMMFVGSRFQAPPLVAHMAFTVLSWWLFGFAVLGGIRATSDCLSEEKRNGTLGLLFLTDLKGRDVVLGKLAAASLRLVYGLLAALPALAVPLVTGGIAPAEVLGTVLAEFNVLFFTLAAGLLVSACSRREGRAMSATAVLIFLVMHYSLMAQGLLDRLGIPWELPEAFAWASPLYAFCKADHAGHQFAAARFWWPLLGSHLTGWLFLARAAWILPRAWQDQAATARSSRWSDWWRRMLQGTAEQRKARRARLLSKNAFLWLVQRDRWQNFMVWGFLCLMGITGVVAGWCVPDLIQPGGYVLAAVILHSGLKLWLAAQAGQRIASDRQSGALELVLATPLSVSAIVSGQHRALRRQFLGPAILVVLADVGLFIAGRNSDDAPGLWTAMMLAGMLIFALDLVTLGWVGLWMGLAARQPNQVTGGAGFRVLVVPWLLWFACFTVHALAAIGTNIEPRLPGLLVWWTLIGMVNDVFWMVWCRRRIYREFRLRATDRYQPARANGWRRWLPVAR